jgi:hypothetical protein
MDSKTTSGGWRGVSLDIPSYRIIYGSEAKRKEGLNLRVTWTVCRKP